MRLPRILKMLSLALLTSSKLSLAAAPVTPPFFLDADEYTAQGENFAELKGNVKIIRGDEQLTCDYARVNMATKDITAEGHVLYLSPENFIRADRFSYNFETKKGVLQNAIVQSDQVTIEGQQLFKISETEFIAEDGSYTACTSCPASWKFSSSKVDANVGGYAHLKNVVFRAYGLPFFYLPYMIVPVKSERQTGLLFPNFSWESGFFHYAQPFFWAIDKSQDVTFTGHTYANRGLKGQLEYRYVLDENSKGILNTSYLKDKQFSESPRLTDDQRAEKQIPRWALNYDHHYELPGRITNNVSVNLVRDLQYPVDFPGETKGYGDPALESRASFTKNEDTSHMSVEAVYYQNLLKKNPLSNNDQSIHKMPALRYSVIEQPIFEGKRSLLFQGDFSYVSFSRPTSTFYDGNQNGLYDPNYNVDPAQRDLARTGQRLILEPKILYPFTVFKDIDVVPAVSFNQAFYQFGYGDKPQASRQYLKGEVTARTRFAKVFGDFADPKSTRFKHEIEPAVTYSVIPYLYKENHIFFGQNDVEPGYLARQPINETDQIQFDYYDRLIDRQIVTYGITNKLIRKRYKNGTTEYREVIRHSLLQSYDLFDAQRDPNRTDTKVQPFSEITSLTDFRFDHFSANSEINYFPYQSITSHSTRMSVFDAIGNAFTVSHLSSFFIPRSKEAPARSFNELIGISAAFVTKYVNFYGGYQYSASQREGQSYDTGILFKPPGDCMGILFSYKYLIGQKIPIVNFAFPIYFGKGQSLSVGTPTMSTF